MNIPIYLLQQQTIHQNTQLAIRNAGQTPVEAFPLEPISMIVGITLFIIGVAVTLYFYSKH